jgi:hypothetical protein
MTRLMCSPLKRTFTLMPLNPLIVFSPKSYIINESLDFFIAYFSNSMEVIRRQVFVQEGNLLCTTFNVVVSSIS